METSLEKMVKAHRRSEGNGSIYEAMYDYDELRNYWVRRTADLGYPLRVEPKRDRLILNKQGWEKAVMDSAQEVSKIIGNDIYNFVREDVYDEIQNGAEYILNSLTYNQNTGFKAAKRPPVKKDFASKLGAMLGRALVKNLSNLWKDITGINRR